MTTEQRAARMMAAWEPANPLRVPLRYAKTAHAVCDISEELPIPRGSVVYLEDYWRDNGLFVVEWHGMHYLADPSELVPFYR
jgi:hypothetical protein